MEKAPPLVLLGGADAHDLVLVEMLIDDYPNIIFVVLTSLNPIIPLRPRRHGLCIVRDGFFIENSSLTHAVVPPFRNRSRSSRLFGCKRPHNGFVSLPLCFGLLLVF